MTNDGLRQLNEGFRLLSPFLIVSTVDTMLNRYALLIGSVAH